MPTEVFSQSLTTPDSAFLHAKAYASESASAGVSFRRGIDLSAGFDVEGALQGRVGKDVSASLQAQADVEGGLQFQAQFPLDVLSAKGAGLVARFKLALEAAASIGLDVSISTEEFLNLLSVRLSGPYGKLLEVLADEFALSAGVWAKMTVSIEIVAEAIAALTLRSGHGVNPGLTHGFRFTSGFIYGSGTHFVSNHSVPNPRIAFSRLGHTVADVIDDALLVYSSGHSLGFLNEALKDAAGLTRIAIPFALTACYDVGAALSKEGATTTGASTGMGVSFLDEAKALLLRNIRLTVSTQLASALGPGGIADVVNAAPDAERQAFVGPLAQLTQAADAFESADTADPEPLLAALLNLIKAMEGLLGAIQLPGDLQSSLINNTAAIVAADCLLHRVLSWRPTGDIDPSQSVFSGVQAPSLPAGQIVASISREGGTLQLTDLLSALLTPTLIDSVLGSVPEAEVAVSWIGDILKVDPGDLLHTVLVDLDHPSTDEIMQLVALLVPAIGEDLLSHLVDDLLTPLGNATTSTDELSKFLSGLVSEILSALARVVAPLSAELAGGQGLGRSGEAVGSVLLGILAQYLSASAAVFIDTLSQQVEGSFKRLITTLNGQGLSSPQAADLRGLAGKMGLDASDVITILGILSDAIQSTDQAFDRAAHAIALRLDLGVGTNAGQQSLKEILGSDGLVGADRLPALLADLVKDGFAVAVAILKDILEIIGVVVVAEGKRLIEAIVNVAVPVLNAIQDYVYKLEQDVDKAIAAVKQFADEIGAAIADVAAAIATWAANMKTKTRQFFEAVRAWGHQQIRAVVWEPLQGLATTAFDGLLDAIEWLGETFFGLIDAAAQAISDAFGGPSAGMPLSPTSLHSSVTQAVHAQSQTDWEAQLNLDVVSVAIPISRSDFARITSDLITNDPEYQQLVDRRTQQAVSTAGLRSRQYSAQRQLDDLQATERTGYGALAVAEVQGFVQPGQAPSIRINDPTPQQPAFRGRSPAAPVAGPPAVGVGQGAVFIDLEIRGANQTFLGSNYLNIPPRIGLRLNGIPVNPRSVFWTEYLGVDGNDQKMWSIRMQALFVADVPSVALSPSYEIVVGKTTAKSVLKVSRRAASPFTAAGAIRRRLLEVERLGPRDQSSRRVYANERRRIVHDPGTQRRVRASWLPCRQPVAYLATREIGEARTYRHDMPQNPKFVTLGLLPRLPAPLGPNNLTVAVIDGQGAAVQSSVTFILTTPDFNLIREVRDRGYYRYLERTQDGTPGSDVDDWVQAQLDVFPPYIQKRAYYTWQNEGQPLWYSAASDWQRAELETWLSAQTW